MVGTDRHESQSPAAPEVGRDVGPQALRTVLKPRSVSALAFYRPHQEPVAGPGRAPRLPQRPFVSAQGGDPHLPWRSRRFLGQEREHLRGGATIDIAGPDGLGRPQDVTEGPRLEAMGKAQTGQPGGEQFIGLGLYMIR